MATSCHGSCTNRAFQGKALTHLRISNNKSGILIFGFPPAVPEQPYDDTHTWESTSLHCFPHLLFIPHPLSSFLLTSFSLWYFSSVSCPPGSSRHLYLSVHPTSQQRAFLHPFSGGSLDTYPVLSCITSSPERPGLPHLPRMNNWIQAGYFLYYLQTQVNILC